MAPLTPPFLFFFIRFIVTENSESDVSSVRKHNRHKKSTQEHDIFNSGL